MKIEDIVIYDINKRMDMRVLKGNLGRFFGRKNNYLARKTLLSDKNGKTLYTGDLVQLENGMAYADYVLNQRGCETLMFIDQEGKKKGTNCEFMIIGNIYGLSPVKYNELFTGFHPYDTDRIKKAELARKRGAERVAAKKANHIEDNKDNE